MRKTIIIVIGVALLTGFGFVFLRGNSSDAVELAMVKVTRGDIRFVLSAIGRVKSAEDTVIRAEYGGIIDHLLVDEGDSVEEDDQLLVFNTTELEIARAQVEIELHQIENYLQHKLFFQRERAGIAKNLAERDLEATRELFEAKVSSELKLKEKEDLYSDAIVAERQTLEDLKDIENQRAMAREQLNLIDARLSMLNITSPQDGIITVKNVEDGSAVGLGQQLFTVADLDRLEIEVEVDEVDLGSVELGQRVEVTSDAFPDRLFEGEIAEFAPTATIQGNTTFVKTTVALEDGAPYLKINNQVDVELIIEERQSVLVLPLSPIARSDDQEFVWLYADGTARKRPVRTGLSSLDSVEILEGLEEGDMVIIRGSVSLREGQQVRPASSEENTSD